MDNKHLAMRTLSAHDFFQILRCSIQIGIFFYSDTEQLSRRILDISSFHKEAKDRDPELQ